MEPKFGMSLHSFNNPVRRTCLPYLYIASHFSRSNTPLLPKHPYSPTHYHMSEEQQQTFEYSFQLPNTVPPMHQEKVTMPRDSAVSSKYQVSFQGRVLTIAGGCFQIHPSPDISHNCIFVPPPAAHPAYYDPHCVGYTQYYEPITPVSLFT